MPREQPATFSPVYRLLASVSNDHLYSVDRNEVATLTQQGVYTYEGVGFVGYAAQQPGTIPLYRFVRADGIHLLDIRRQTPADPFARMEGVLCYIANQQFPGLVPLYAWNHPQLGLWFYTTHPQGEFAAQIGYRPVGILGYVAPGQF
jgi:hypothetical protein